MRGPQAQTIDSGKAKAQLRPPARPRVARARRETVARNTGSSGANSNSIYDGAARDSKRFFLTPRTFSRGRSSKYYSRDRSNKDFASPTFPSVADQTLGGFQWCRVPLSMAPGGYLAPSLKVISGAIMVASNDCMIAPKYSITVL